MGRPRETRGDSDLMRRRLSRSRGRRSAASFVAVLAVFGVILSTQAGAAPAALPSLSISNSEGTGYQTAKSSMTFTVTLSAPSATTVTVDFATRDDPNPFENDDYDPAAGTLTFAPGETSKTIEIGLRPEPFKTFEDDEIFYVDLSSPLNATIDKGAGVGIVHFRVDPAPENVLVTAKGDGGQCVQTVDSSGCVPLSGGSVFAFDDIEYINPGRRAIELHTSEGIARFLGSPFGLGTVAASASGRGRPVILVKLRGGNFGACTARTLSDTRSTSGVAKEKPKPAVVRRLWGKGKGRFRTRGRYSSGTVRGTWWLTVDRCDGTRTLVREGVVSVYDFVLKKHVKVPAGQSYLASPKKKP